MLRVSINSGTLSISKEFIVSYISLNGQKHPHLFGYLENRLVKIFDK